MKLKSCFILFSGNNVAGNVFFGGGKFVKSNYLPDIKELRAKRAILQLLSLRASQDCLILYVYISN